MNKMFTLRRPIAVILFVTCLAASTIHAALVTLTPAESEVSLGSTFTLDLSVSDLGSDNVGAFDIMLDYDPSILEFTGFYQGTQLGTGSDAILDYDIVAPGHVDIAMTSLLPDLSGQPESFLLGSAAFKGIGYGISQIALSMISLGNGDGSAFISATAGPAASASVPEPPILPMLAASMLGIGFWRRHQRTTN